VAAVSGVRKRSFNGCPASSPSPAATRVKDGESHLPAGLRRQHRPCRVIQIEFDPQKISYQKLLHYFWEAHDPTTLNQQGADTGTQYRSVILYNSEAQKLAAEKSKLEAQANFKSPIVTEIVPLKSSIRRRLSSELLQRQLVAALLRGSHPSEGGED